MEYLSTTEIAEKWGLSRRRVKKYKYPPEDYDFAISTVISQCELWTDNEPSVHSDMK